MMVWSSKFLSPRKTYRAVNLLIIQHRVLETLKALSKPTWREGEIKHLQFTDRKIKVNDLTIIITEGKVDLLG